MGRAPLEVHQCTKSVDAFDPADARRLIGKFDPGTTLEIVGSHAVAGMIRVRYSMPNGQVIEAICRAIDLGKEAVPSKKSSLSPASSQSKAANPTSADLPPIFQKLVGVDPQIWNTPSSHFALHHSRFGFHWVSSVDQKASRSAQPLTLFGLPVYETIARFENGTLHQINLLVYGRGDAKEELEEKQFEEQLSTLQKELDEVLQFKGVDAWVKPSGVETKRKSWFRPPLRVDLEWSATHNLRSKDVEKGRSSRFRGEFIRLVATPYDGTESITSLTKPNFQNASSPPVRLKDLLAKIQRESNGDIYLKDFPMVDQGQKGYCVVASSERVLRYYNIDMDQNEIAKLANSSQNGTSVAGMAKALKKVSSRYSLVTRELYQPSDKDFFKDVEEYNRLAKRKKEQEIILPESGLINTDVVYDKMKPELLKEVRLKEKSSMNRFFADVTGQIDRGGPALWGVMLGVVPEMPKLPQERGGHMRLIIGYNKGTGELIYTDSWGAGHEFKRMSVGDAFSITFGLYSVLPGS
jgi:hypothetical protein